MSAQLKPKKRRVRPIFFTVERLVRPETGESVGALVPTTYWDTRAMRERKYTVGKELRAELKQPRNVKFYRLAHALGAWLADNVDGFEGLAQHDAVKKLRELSGIGCETVVYDLPGIGKISRTEAESLNFEDMDESRWLELWSGTNGHGGWIGWLRREKWGSLSSEQIGDVELLIMGENA